VESSCGNPHRIDSRSLRLCVRDRTIWRSSRTLKNKVLLIVPDEYVPPYAVVSERKRNSRTRFPRAADTNPMDTASRGAI